MEIAPITELSGDLSGIIACIETDYDKSTLRSSVSVIDLDATRSSRERKRDFFPIIFQREPLEGRGNLALRKRAKELPHGDQPA